MRDPPCADTGPPHWPATPPPARRATGLPSSSRTRPCTIIRSPMGSPVLRGQIIIVVANRSFCRTPAPCISVSVSHQHAAAVAANAQSMTRRLEKNIRAACPAPPSHHGRIGSLTPLKPAPSPSQFPAHPDAHRRQAPLPAGPFQLMRRRHHQPRAAHSQRMPQCNRTSCCIHMLRIIGKAQLLEGTQATDSRKPR